MSSRNGNLKGGVFSRLWFRVGHFTSPSLRHLLDRDRFKRALDFERARAERSDSAFVLVRIRLISGQNGKKGHDELFAHFAALAANALGFPVFPG